MNLPSADELDWQIDAACRGESPDLFFPPEQPDGTHVRETAKMYAPARAICVQCPAREPCLEYALEHGECCGMWGGLTRPERSRLARQRRRQLAEGETELAPVVFDEVKPGVYEVR